MKSSYEIPLICEVINLPNRNKRASSIINKLASNEESISKLYRGYAGAFPILREFWSSLVGEEVDHAFCSRNLGGKLDWGGSEFEYTGVVKHLKQHYK